MRCSFCLNWDEFKFKIIIERFYKTNKTVILALLLAVKNNNLSNESLPKSFVSKSGQLRELNLSGNSLKQFPEQILELKLLKYLYLGGNQIQSIHKDIWRLTSLQLLSLGGNQITEIPETIGHLNNLQALIMVGSVK